MTVYVITNTVNGKQYVGQTRASLAERWRQHVSDSQRIDRRKGCRALHAAIAKYGAAAFTLHAMAMPGASQAALDSMEVRLIAAFNSIAPRGYNLKTGGSRGQHTDETRALMSQSQRGRTATAETRALLSAVHKGKPLSSAHRQKLSLTQKGRPSRLKGTKLPPQWCANMSAALKGRKGPNLGRKFSPEWRAKMSAALKGRVGAMTGKRHSPEAIEKIRKSNRRTWAAKRSGSPQ